MNESTVLPSTFYPRPSTKTYTLFHTITSLWVEFSLSTLYFYDSSPTVFSRFGMDLAGNLDSCYLTRYPKTLMTFSGRNPFSFWLTSVSLTFVVVWYFVLRKKYIFPRIVMSVWCWPLLAIELEAKNPFESQLQDLLLQVPFPLYPETFSPSWIYIAYPRQHRGKTSTYAPGWALPVSFSVTLSSQSLRALHSVCSLWFSCSALCCSCFLLFCSYWNCFYG